MDIELFINKRKELRLSQAELCEGICTQATLSRLENNGQIPSLKILMRLASRLQLGLGDLFPSHDVQDVNLVRLMDEAELALTLMSYDKTAEALAAIDPTLFTVPSQQWRYLYLYGYSKLLGDGTLSDALFYLNLLLTETTDSRGSIFEQLAYTGLGIAYLRAEEPTRAQFFFEKALDKKFTCQVEDWTSLVRSVTNLLYRGEYYAATQNYSQSNACYQQAIQLLADNHTTYYLPRLYYGLVQNALHMGEEQAVVDQYLNSATAFISLYKQHPLQAELAELVASRKK